MTLKIGYRKETVYGTNPLSGAGDYVYYFGDDVEKGEIEVPWHETSVVPVYQGGRISPVNLVEGAKNVEFSHRFHLRGADMIAWGLGSIATGNTFTGIKGATGDLSLPSFTTYVETDWDDVVVVKGCVVKSFDLYFDKLLPTLMEVKILGSEVATHAQITTATSPRYNAALALTECWKWGDNNAIKLDTTDIIGDGGEINRIHAHVENILKPRFSDKIVEIRKVGMAVQLDFDIPAKTSANLLLAAVRTAATNDFYYKWLRGAYYLELWANNCKFRAMKCTQKIGDAEQPVYNIAGQAFYDSTNTGFEEPFKFKAVDGVTYA